MYTLPANVLLLVCVYIHFHISRSYLKHLKAKYIQDMQQLALEETYTETETTPYVEATTTNLDSLQLSPVNQEQM